MFAFIYHNLFVSVFLVYSFQSASLYIWYILDIRWPNRFLKDVDHRTMSANDLFIAMKVWAEPAKFFWCAHNRRIVNQCAANSHQKSSQVLSSEFFLLLNRLPCKYLTAKSALLFYLLSVGENDSCLFQGHWIYCYSICDLSINLNIFLFTHHCLFLSIYLSI